MSKRYVLQWRVAPGIRWVDSTETNLRWWAMLLYRVNSVVQSGFEYQVVDTRPEEP